MKLFSFWRSLATYRVRIALNLKGIVPDEVVDIDLIKGKQREDAFREVNPQMVLPALVDGDGPVLFQSLAIMEYLDETHPQPPLLPKEPRARARVRGLAQIVACDSHPLLVPRVREYLEHELKLDEPTRLKWIQNWIGAALKALETNLAGSKETGRYCQGDAITIADICLASQAAGANFYKYDLDAVSDRAPDRRHVHAERRLCPRASHAPARRAAGGLIGRVVPGLVPGLHAFITQRARHPVARHEPATLKDQWQSDLMKLATFKANGRTSYGAVTDGGIIDLGRKLAKYPTLLDVFRAQAIAEARCGGEGRRPTTRSRTWRCCRRYPRPTRTSASASTIRSAAPSTRTVGRRRNIPTCSAVFRPRWSGPTSRSCGRRCPTSSITRARSCW